MSELETSKPLVISAASKSYLLYGAGGSGKTTFALQHPGHGYVLDMDQKLAEMENLPLDVQKRITVWTPNVPLGGKEIQIPYSPDAKNVSAGEQIKEEPLGFRKLVNVTNELLALARKPGPFPYDFVVLDSLSRADDHLIYQIMWRHKVTFMTERLWGLVGRALSEYINGFLQLPCVRIIIAHDKFIQDEESGRISIKPLVVGSKVMTDNLPTFFSEVYYFKGRQSDGAYKIQTGKDYTLSARTTKGLAFEEVIRASIFDVKGTGK